MNSSKQNCDIVLDLLPLYHDDMLREETKQYVEKHLETCESCRREYDALCRDVSLKVEDSYSRQLFDNTMRKAKRHRNRITLIIIVIVWLVTCGIGNFLLEQTVVPVDDNEVDIYDVYRYQHGGRTSYYIFYALPDHVPSEIRPAYKIGKDGDLEISFNMKRSFLAREDRAQSGEMWTFDIEKTDAASVVECGDTSKKIENISAEPGYIEEIEDADYKILPEDGIIIGNGKIWNLRGELLME